jgi:hypothetical protein
MYITVLLYIAEKLSRIYCCILLFCTKITSFYSLFLPALKMHCLILYQIRRPLGLAFVIYFWWLGELLLLYI